MAIFNGNQLTLRVATDATSSKVPLAHSTDCSISFTNDLVEATLGDSNGWAEFITGRKSATINFSGLTDYGTITNRYNVEDVGDFLLQRETLYIIFGRGGNHFEATGLLESIEIEGSTDDVSTYSGTIITVDDITDDLEAFEEKLQDSEGNDILDDSGSPITVLTLQ